MPGVERKVSCFPYKNREIPRQSQFEHQFCKKVLPYAIPFHPDSIALLYDNLGFIKSDNKRLEIQKKINDLNLKASEYAIPNEFDRILEGMGGTGINAFTSNDVIAYFNQFPPHQINKWLEVNSHTFINPVSRLFQSELEVVYEEKNRAMDNPFRKLIEEYFEHFWKKHPYEQQTVLGTVDHLKNPSS